MPIAWTGVGESPPSAGVEITVHAMNQDRGSQWLGRRMLQATGLLLLMAGSAHGQDSVSINVDGGSGLPGDALRPFSLTVPSQRASYVVDLTPFQTSLGTPLGVAPIVKSGRLAAGRFTMLNGPAVISSTLRTGVAAPSSSYSLWTQAGGGINGTENDPARVSAFTPPTSVNLASVAFLDYDEVLVSNTPVFFNQIVTASIAHDPAAPSRLLVTRVVAAVNATASNQGDLSQLGLGTVDADGNVVFRADGLGCIGTAAQVITGENALRVASSLRSASVLNTISVTGGSDAGSTSRPLANALISYAVPTAIPSEIAGRSLMVTADFTGSLAVETSPGVLTGTTAHRSGSIDHRGAPVLAAVSPAANVPMLGAVLSRSPVGGGRTDSISVFGMSASGAVSLSRTLTLPSTLSDTCGGSFAVGPAQFRQYDGQATFRGGVSPVAVGREPSGQSVVAATLSGGVPAAVENPRNAIAVASLDASNPGSAVTWRLAAWVDPASGTGKAIRGDFGQDGAPGTNDPGEGDGVVDGLDASIGRLAAASEIGAPFTGPSLSAPGFDGAGNVYFIATTRLRERQGATIVEVGRVALVRAVLDSSGTCYTLDLVLRSGETFVGANSGTRYQISALMLGDNDSSSSASLWSTSVAARTLNNVDRAALSGPLDPAAVAGVVLPVRVTYDVNGDNQFVDPSSPGADPLSADEAYQVVLFIGGTQSPPSCPPDINGDGEVDPLDVRAFFDAYRAGDPAADFNQDQEVDPLDIRAFFDAYRAGC